MQEEMYERKDNIDGAPRRTVPCLSEIPCQEVNFYVDIFT